MQFHNYKERLEKINENRMPHDVEETTLVDLFYDFIHAYRKENHFDDPTHVIVSATTRLDLIKAFHDTGMGFWELDDDNQPEKVNGMIIAIVTGIHEDYLELV